jgi:Domain of unknown function (DUF1707)
MAAPSTPPQTRESQSRRRASYANPGMRVSDAERAEVADRLSQHFGDGRLDQEEFDKRLSQAMGATVQSDLHGLFADLPDDSPEAGPTGGSASAGFPGSGAAGTEASGAGQLGAGPRGSGPPGPAGRRPRRYRRLVAIILIIVIAIGVGHALAQVAPWLLIAALAFLWLRHGPWPRRRL